MQYTNKGLTLIELMVVVAILAVISGIAVSAYSGYMRTSRFAEAQTQIESIALAQSEFFLQNNTYFQTAGVVTVNMIEPASNNLYKAPISGTQWFDFNVQAGIPCGNPNSCYRITAQGKNDMIGEAITRDGP